MRTLCCLLVVCSSFFVSNSLANTPSVLWYTAPATDWQKQAVPIGNGRLGGMVFGGIEKEQIQFNEDSLWIGDESDTGSYQNFGDIFIETGHADATDYRRQLDISTGVHTITYKVGDVTYTREYFASNPAQVMVLRLSASKPGAISGTVSVVDAHGKESKAEGNVITIGGDLAGFVYSGGSTRGRTEPYKIVLDYEAQLQAINDGGSVKAVDGTLTYADCDSLILLLAADTNYLNRRDKGWKGEHPHAKLVAQLAAASKKSFDNLKAEHIKDFASLYDRCTIDWGTSKPETLAKSTSERFAAYKNGAEDPDLEEQLFQYARYLMISSSRPGALPANLQGLWNHSNRPPWRSDYHTDVNIQMNYWFVDAANISECFEPLAEWVHSIRGVRRDETEATFGTRGWISHAENGVFGGSTWKWSKGDAAWVAQNLFDHYAFTKDKDYLENRLYPVLKELCEFWEDHLKELEDGTLVAPDGFSPEHGPHEDGVSFDQQLAWDVFTNYIEASEALGVDEEFRKKVASMRDRLLGPQIGKWGQLQEWMVDRDDPKDQHRHLSHMIAVHPGRQISPLTTPEFAEAARVSMNARGDASTGWSRAWKISIWARLHDGNRAYSILQSMQRAMIYDNMFNTHPPFQIDGNFGFANGICEMLLQSHMDEIHLHPALPDAWATGTVKGMRARGGVDVDMAWKDGKLTSATLRATVDGKHTLRAPEGQQIDGPTTVELKAGETHEVKFR